MTIIRLPGLVDVHVHMREPGGEYKETWASGTAAALAGGITTVLAMPNTSPAVTDSATLDLASATAERSARCDHAHWVGATADNAATVASLAPRAAGIKLYLDRTFGDLRLDETAWAGHLETWPSDSILAAHAEGETLSTFLDLAARVGRGVHVCHVATEQDITLIAAAKERGEAVTCEVTPHHLFLDRTTALSGGRAEVRPPLGTPRDRKALWSHLDVIDCFATDHAPHTAAEKDGPHPPPGFPGVETMLPLLLTAVHDGLLDLDDVVRRLHHNPTRIFGLPGHDDTWIEVDPDASWVVGPGHSGAGWSPFEGTSVQGKVTKVVSRGVTAFEKGTVVAAPGSGRDLRAGGDT